MQHYRLIDDVHIPGSWVSVGTFDGVHAGHRAVLSQMAAGAHDAGLPAVVVTFFPHPAVVLRGLETPHYLTLPDERAELLAETGIDAVVTLEFTREMSTLSALRFMEMLSQHLGIRQLWAGSDFALGRNREGDLAALQRLGEALGYTVHSLQPVRIDGRVVSSSQVRALLAEGQVREAAQLLGRPYQVGGPVVHGDARGRTIGIPTANIDIWPQKILPANGVYAGWALLGGQRVAAVTNIGVRPTFGTLPPLPRVEAHLLDFNHDLYGQTLRLEFLQRLRAEQRFSSIEALVEQIHTDIRTAREVLQHEP